MSRATVSLGVLLALATPACGWTTYTFVPVDDASDATLGDATDGDIDAGFDAAPDVQDTGPVDAGPLVRFGRVSLLYTGGSARSIAGAIMVQQPASTGVTHSELIFNPVGATCNFVHTEMGAFSAMPVIPSADYGPITFSGADGGVVTVNRVSGIYQPVINLPSLWHPPVAIAISAPGAGGLPALSYNMQLTGNVDVVMPTPTVIDRTMPYTFTWNVAQSLALIHIHQSATDGSWNNDLFCSPNNVSQTSLTISAAALGHLACRDGASDCWRRQRESTSVASHRARSARSAERVVAADVHSELTCACQAYRTE